MRICTLVVMLALGAAGGCRDKAATEQAEKEAAQASQNLNQAIQESREAQAKVVRYREVTTWEYARPR